jgi:hypothetical protein
MGQFSDQRKVFGWAGATFKEESAIAPQAFSFVFTNTDGLNTGFCVLKGTFLIVVEVIDEQPGGVSASDRINKLRLIVKNAVARI